MSDADDIIAHYASGYEDERLATGCGPLEFARTVDILDRQLPRPHAIVLDVGGGTGPYSRWLASRGYEVHLVDLSPLNVDLARKAGQIASATVGDARSLVRGDASVDAVLLMGPLYHLTDRAGRLAALREARRVLKPGGVLAAAAISRYASLLDGLRSGYLDDPVFATIVEQDLKTGQHRNPTDHAHYFTSAYFHRPEDLREEVQEAALEVVSVVGIEGPGWLLPEFEAHWSDPARRRRLVEAARRTESEPALLGLSAHLLAVARRA